jgi:hypothetical protein
VSTHSIGKENCQLVRCGTGDSAGIFSADAWRISLASGSSRHQEDAWAEWMLAAGIVLFGLKFLIASIFALRRRERREIPLHFRVSLNWANGFSVPFSTFARRQVQVSVFGS